MENSIGKRYYELKKCGVRSNGCRGGINCLYIDSIGDTSYRIYDYYESSTEENPKEAWRKEDYAEYSHRGNKLVPYDEYESEWIIWGDYIYKSFYDVENVYIPDTDTFELKIKDIFYHKDGTFTSSGNYSGVYIRNDELLKTTYNDGSYFIDIIHDHKINTGSYFLEETEEKIAGRFGIKIKTQVSSINNKRDSIISQSDFVTKYSCPHCNRIGIWDVTTWNDNGVVCAECKKCGYFLYAVNQDDLVDLKNQYEKIVAKVDKTIQERKAPWDKQYFDYACPYCGKFTVRMAKWEDKQFSTAFWGFFSRKLHSHYKCDSCKEMWE